MEDRQDILGHKSGRITTHYSAPEIGNLVAAVNRIADSRGIHARTVLAPSVRLQRVKPRPVVRKPIDLIVTEVLAHRKNDLCHA